MLFASVSTRGHFQKWQVFHWRMSISFLVHLSLTRPIKGMTLSCSNEVELKARNVAQRSLESAPIFNGPASLRCVHEQEH